MRIRKKRTIMCVALLLVALSVVNLMLSNTLPAGRRFVCRALYQPTALPSYCAEVYKGSTYGYPFYRKGHERVNCTRNAMGKILTIILDSPCIGDANCSLANITRNINITYPNVTVFVIKQQNRAREINNIICKIQTPFVFIAANLADFDENVDFQRLVHVLESNKKIRAVGSAVKNTRDGEWSHACSQIDLHSYTMWYINGYAMSNNSCLYCDILHGPFLVRTQFLRQVKFKENFVEGFYEDWFMRISPRMLERWKNKNVTNRGLVVSCPDVMSNILPKDIPDSDWLEFAADWDIKKIVSADGKIKWFGCRRGIQHRLKRKCPLKSGMSVPPCCMANLADAVKFIMRACEQHDIVCELQEGTLLGAVKFQKVLPWERDADITFLTADFEKMKKLGRYYQENGYSISPKDKPWCCVDGRPAGGTFSVNADGWAIELYGQHIMDSHEKIMQGKQPSKIRFDGELVNVPDSPGLFARNRYGNEIYQHAEHWMVKGHKSGWDKYLPGQFQNCASPGHHGCLDQFTADGNLQFD